MNSIVRQRVLVRAGVCIHDACLHGQTLSKLLYEVLFVQTPPLNKSKQEKQTHKPKSRQPEPCLYATVYTKVRQNCALCGETQLYLTNRCLMTIYIILVM